MKTVQEVLKSIDENELIDSYLATYPVSLKDFDDEVTVGDAQKYTQLRLHQYIDRLKNIKIKPDKNQGIFFICRMMKDGMGDVESNLVFVDDLKKEGLKANNYGFEFNPQAEIMGWQIADNQLTQTYLTDLLVEILEEASFFGYKQEGLEEETRKLEDCMKEAKENPDSMISMSSDELKEMFDFDKQTDTEEQLEMKASLAEGEYYNYSRNKELSEIIEQIGIEK